VSKLKDFLFSSKVAILLLTEMLLGIFLSISSNVLFIKLSTEVFEQPAFIYDQTISQIIYSLRSPLLTKIMLLITHLGGSYVLIPATIITIFLIIRKHQEEAFLFSIILIMGLILNTSLKSILHRPRPDITPLINETSYSFPSGHAMNSFVFYTTVSFYSFRFTRKKKLSIFISFASLLMILLIGFSRVYLGVHYPTDILAGYFAGLAWFATAIFMEKTIFFFKYLKAEEKQ